MNRYERAQLGGPSGAQVTVLTVDPDTLPRFAFWDGRFAAGDHSTDPMVVVSAVALDDRGAGASRFTEYWSDRDLDTLTTALDPLGVRVSTRSRTRAAALRPARRPSWHQPGHQSR